MHVRKIPIELKIEYGVLTEAKRNVIRVEAVASKGDPATEAKDLKDAAIKIKALPTALKGEPVYEKIADVEQLKAYCRDYKMDEEIDMRKNLEDMRADVRSLSGSREKVRQ